MSKTKKDIPVFSLCTIDGAAESGREELSVYRFGEYLSERDFLFQPHRHSFYHLVYFTKGGGGHTLDFVQFPVEPGQIYFMIPGQVHHWQFSPDQDTDGYIVNFSKGLFSKGLFSKGVFAESHLPGAGVEEEGLEQFRFFRGRNQEQVIGLSVPAQREVVGLFEKILIEQEGEQAYAEQMSLGLLWQLFITVARECPPADGVVSKPGYPLLRQFEKLVEEHYTRLKLPKEYAALLHVTANYLNALSNEILGSPAGTIIRERILLEAKRLLVNVDFTISEIAFRLNFPDNSYFSKFFKKYTGQTPEGFRKAYAGRS